MKHTHPRGQLLLISLVLVTLVAAAVPLLLSIVSRVGKRFVDRSSDARVSNVARAAFTQVGHTLESQPEAWQRVMAGDVLNDLGYDGEKRFEGLHKTPYTVFCERDNPLFADRMRVTVKVQVRDRMTERARVFQAILSHRTLGVDVPGLAHAPAALYLLNDAQLTSKGLGPPQLDVLWGSIVCFGTLELASEPNAALGHHPRKFCATGFKAAYPVAPKTDHQEYWVGFPMGAPVDVDLELYRKLAVDQTEMEGLRFGQGARGGYVRLNNQTVLFEAAGPRRDETVPQVFYIDGSVRLESSGIDLKNGAMIVSQNVIFEDHRQGAVMMLRVPPHADREFPFLDSDRTFPCAAQLGATCSSQDALPGYGRVDFRGFLYVKGDLYINRDTVIAGVVRVDGSLRIASGQSLTVLFDDQISRSILLKETLIEHQIISQPAVPR